MNLPLASRWLAVKTLVASVVLLGACVTINVYFPTAAAEKAADRIIDQVYGTEAAPPAPPAPPANDKRTSLGAPSSAPAGDATPLLLAAAGRALDLLVPAAHAQGAPDLNVSTPAIRQLVASMEARHGALSPHYASGAVGIGADGLLAVRDQNAIPLPERNAVRKLVAEENADRSALYDEIARANGKPEWAAQIKSTFARRWIDRAQGGWWFQDESGAWKQK